MAVKKAENWEQLLSAACTQRLALLPTRGVRLMSCSMRQQAKRGLLLCTKT